MRPGSGANQNARRAAARDHVGGDLVVASRERDVEPPGRQRDAVEDVRQDGCVEDEVAVVAALVSPKKRNAYARGAIIARP
jgi:hypothetical protein